MRKALYTNHLGITVEFNTSDSPFTLNPLPLRTYEATATVMSDKITSFSSKGVKNYGVTIGAVGKTTEETAENYDYLSSVFEADILAVSPGTLEVNGYSLKCFISGLTPQNSLKRAKEAIATVITDNSLWYKELFTMLFTKESSIILDSVPEEYAVLTYPHDYPYGYPSGTTVREVDNPALRPTHFRLIIEGPTDSPTLIIAGHTYSVNATVPSGSKLIIDSRAASIVIVDEYGAETNAFDKRNRESDIFEKIPVGISQISFSNVVEKFYLTLIDERRYPQWST